MSDEPSKSKIEPVSESPLGNSGTVLSKTEPSSNTEEPSKGASEPAKAEPQQEEFTNLKEVPPQLQGAAKKIQADLTRRAQKLAERERAIAPSTQPATPEEQELEMYLASPQGKILDSYIEKKVGERLGDLPQRVMTQEADKEIESVISKYGEDNIKANYPQIQEIMAEHPEVPLDMIVSNVMYAKAKEQGANELRQKLEEKRGRSLQLGRTTPVVSKDETVNNWDDAVKAAITKHSAF